MTAPTLGATFLLVPIQPLIKARSNQHRGQISGPALGVQPQAWPQGGWGSPSMAVSHPAVTVTVPRVQRGGHHGPSTGGSWSAAAPGLSASPQPRPTPTPDSM